MKTEIKEKIEKKLNSLLKNLYYIQDPKEDDTNDIDAWNIVYPALKDLGYNLNTDRKNENIIKLEDEWENGARIHIYIKKCELVDITDNTNILYRKSINYLPLLKKCNFDNDEVVRTWYVSVV